MPTGYTAKLCDGKQSFQDFVMGCARAFGACVTLRDEPNSEIPKEFKPSDYHIKEISSARKTLKKLEGMSAADSDREARRHFQEELKDYEESRQRARETCERLLSMREKVSAWNPPTRDHNGLKEFMVDQLDQTIKFDGEFSQNRPTLKTGDEFRRGGIEREMLSIAYHENEHRKEIERCAGRTEWVRALRNSIHL